MAATVIQNNESIVPFFGDSINFIRGLDPLSLQNASDATFSQILPGLNNVTNRIRYYSFYCWLLDIYSQQMGSTDPKVQQQFIRRAEYMIALASHYFTGDKTGIPGTNYAWGEIGIKGKTVHQLQSGTYKADGSTRETYWNYALGAFGQYYLGSIRDIGIITERTNDNKVYIRTNKKEDGTTSGEALAAAFDKNIDTDNKALFLACIKKGVVTKADLETLLPDFDLTLVPKDSEEQQLLIELLLQKDFPLLIEEKPSALRKQTIFHILSFIAANEGDFEGRAFIYHCYDNKGIFQNKANECLMSWYYYQFNEFWHFANTSIFNGALAYLERVSDPNWYPLHQFIEEVSDKIVAYLHDIQLISSNDSTLAEAIQNMPKEKNIYEYFDETINSSHIDKAANGFLLIFQLYLTNQAELISLKSFAEEHHFTKEGEGTGYFITQFEPKKALSIAKFIHEYLYLNIIYRHQYVAFRKMGGGNLSTQKFIIEDQYIRYLGNFEATYTGPRIDKLVDFLTDLDIISENDTLTKRGVSLLNELTNSHD